MNFNILYMIFFGPALDEILEIFTYDTKQYSLQKHL